MGVLMVKCPKTGCAISTGMTTDRPSFDHSPVFFGRTFCPIYRVNHEWFAKDAWVQDPGLIEDEPAARQLAIC
jgi:hypothetical protein